MGKIHKKVYIEECEHTLLHKKSKQIKCVSGYRIKSKLCGWVGGNRKFLGISWSVVGFDGLGL